MLVLDFAPTQTAWDDFLKKKNWSPFLQSFAMAEVYKTVHQASVRIALKQNDEIVGICFGHVVMARRGKHLAVPYGPVISDHIDAQEALAKIIYSLKVEAKKNDCTFIRISPFWPQETRYSLSEFGARNAALHMLAEQIWFIRLEDKSEDQILMNMRKTTRNLIRRAEKEGVAVRASKNPLEDLDYFIRLHDETRARHKFTPYTNSFFRAQVEQFSKEGMCTLYLAEHQSKVIAASIHVHFGGETSYHHGASSSAHAKIPASYLLQWTAIKDAMKRGDGIYNFWGIAPIKQKKNDAKNKQTAGGLELADKHHPFAGVTIFKTGFGGELLSLVHCMDIPLSSRYYLTRGFEFLRKWRRGF